LYHDKRFQTDPMFSLLCFHHRQIKSSSIGGFVMAARNNFPRIAERLRSVDQNVLADIIRRLSDNETITDKTPEEKRCFQILDDLDHVGAHVPGSRTMRKYERTEIWAITSYVGAPLWYITFAPADVNHPIAIYFAGDNETYYPVSLSRDERIRAIANNSVACAKFFMHVVYLFITHVLGYGSDHPGLWGNTRAYYGTIEQ
ncbi:hypothetical protein FA95DRAFT_1462212, partial [Auriscalpium vulgare]